MPTTSTNWEKAPPLLLLLRGALWTVTEVPSGAWPTKSAPSDLNTFITVVTLRPRYFFNRPAFTMGRGLDVSAIAHQPNKRKGGKKKKTQPKKANATAHTICTELRFALRVQRDMLCSLRSSCVLGFGGQARTLSFWVLKACVNYEYKYKVFKQRINTLYE